GVVRGHRSDAGERSSDPPRPPDPGLLSTRRPVQCRALAVWWREQLREQNDERADHFPGGPTASADISRGCDSLRGQLRARNGFTPGNQPKGPNDAVRTHVSSQSTPVRCHVVDEFFKLRGRRTVFGSVPPAPPRARLPSGTHSPHPLGDRHISVHAADRREASRRPGEHRTVTRAVRRPLDRFYTAYA